VAVKLDAFLDNQPFSIVACDFGIHSANMNGESQQTLNIAITGTLTISSEELEKLFSRMTTSSLPAVEGPSNKKLVDGGKLPRLAFSMKETAEILGISYQTVWRLIQRGLLRSSLALRCKMISKAEIERFLRETSKSLY